LVNNAGQNVDTQPGVLIITGPLMMDVLEDYVLHSNCGQRRVHIDLQAIGGSSIVGRPGLKSYRGCEDVSTKVGKIWISCFDKVFEKLS
jgi:hypothetical protein